jgi:hypothetical protein
MTTKVKASVIDTVANTQITGLITSGQIATVANTQITGLILPEQIAGGSVVTSVSVTSPITNSGSSAAPNINIQAASSSQNGYMSSTYASKLDGIAAGATNVTNNNQLTNGAGYVTSSALSGYATQSYVVSQGYVTSASLYGYATTSQLSNYLPLTGGTLSNNLVINNGGSGVLAFGGLTWAIGYDASVGFLSMGSASGPRLSVSAGAIQSSTDNVLKPSGGTWGSYSDRRLKENITNYTKGLNDINTLRTVNFNFIGKLGEQTNKKTITGLIAQDVLQTNFANIVSTNSDGMYNIDSSELIFALVNAVQELSAEVRTLKAKLPN